MPRYWMYDCCVIIESGYTERWCALSPTRLDSLLPNQRIGDNALHLQDNDRIQANYSPCGAPAGDRQRRRTGERLVDHTVPLRQAQEGVELFFGSIGLEREFQPDVLEADRHFLEYAERTAEIQVAFGLDRGVAQGNTKRGGDGIQGDAGATDQGFK